MKEKLKNLWEKVKKFWKGLTTVLKIVIVAGAAALIIGAIILTVVLNSSDEDDFIVLFPDMSTEESAQVYQELQGQGVETEINSEGEIMVRRNEWDNLVYQLAEKGYPQTAPSYGTFFDNLSMTMTEFEKQQTLRFELQDRLQTTLKRIEGIKGAVVTITFPEKSDYAWKQNEDTAKASVTLTLSNSAAFTAANVSAVKNLVAFSAQKIEPENVRVIDSTTGQELLSTEELAISNDNSGIDLADKLEYVNAIKAQYENNVREILKNMYPKGVDVVASVSIDYDKVVEEARRLLPDEETGQGYVTDEHKEYDTNNKPVDEGGVVGEENNDDIPNYQNDEEDNLNSDDTVHYEDDVKLDLGYLLTQTERAQGTVKDASISVVVASENAFMSRDERNAIIGIVRNATNIDEDKISVYSRVVTDEETEIEEEKSIFDDATMRWLLIIGIILGVLLIAGGIITFILLRRAKRRRLEEQAAHEEQVAELQEMIEEERKRTIEEQADEHNKKERETEEQVREFARNNPELTAALIRSMLKERDD
jgi:flagellar basal-body M-ring protein/flagellar hook-basal body protein fliF